MKDTLVFKILIEYPVLVTDTLDYGSKIDCKFIEIHFVC